MLSGNECPVCGENIGMWAVFRAPMPNRIYCPHCGERVQYGDTNLMILAAVLLLIALVGAGMGTAILVSEENPVLAGVILLGSLILGGITVEVVFVLILWYGSFRLESVTRPKTDWDDEF